MSIRDGKRKYSHGISNLGHVSLWVAFCALGFLIFSVGESHAAGFVLKKIDSGYEPEAYEAVTIPGTDMKAGEYAYELDNGERVRKAGILVNGEVLYYVESSEYADVPGPLPPDENYVTSTDPSGDCNYGLHGKYLLLDCWCCGSASGHSRVMYLFKTVNGAVELLDGLQAGMMDFTSRPEDGEDRTEKNYLLTKLEDIDNDGNPEVELGIERGDRLSFIFQLRVFILYFEIAGDKLRLDLNPVLYKPLYEQAKLDEPSKRVPQVYSVKGEGFPSLVPTSPKGRSDAYYIYGLLSGELTLDEIKSALVPDGELYEGQYESVVPLLEQRDKWDDGFHFAPAERPVLLNYELNGRQESWIQSGEIS